MLTLDSVLSSSIEALESAVESRLCMTHFREGVSEFLFDAKRGNRQNRQNISKEPKMKKILKLGKLPKIHN